MDSLYKEVVDATADYLGPSADRFVSRQIVGHLGKSPEKLKNRDLNILIKWIKPAIALLTDDTEAVDNYISSLKSLSKKKRK
jgi:hypothetical protein